MIGAKMAEVLGRARGPVTVVLPLRGVSALDAPGLPFHDPKADAALFAAIREGLAGTPHARVVELDLHINDAAFAEAASNFLLESL